MKFVIFATVFFTIIISAFGQEKAFYSAYGVEADTVEAFYYLVFTKEDRHAINPGVAHYYKIDKTFYNEKVDPNEKDVDRYRTYYHPNGQIKLTGNFFSGRPFGTVTSYYENGNLQGEFEFEKPDFVKDPVIGIINYYDPAGKQLIKDGNGICNCNLSPFNGNLIYEKGIVINGLKEGDWVGSDNEKTFTFNERYGIGELIMGVLYSDGKEYRYHKTVQSAVPEGGMDNFYRHVSSVVKYPKKAIRRFIEGSVYVGFIVDIDGRLTNIKVVSGISKECDEYALKAVYSAPNWKPTLIRGKPVRQRITLPIIFRLSP